MVEHFTQGLVLDKQELGEYDGLVTIYTRDLGKISAKSKSLKKITSKLSAHLEPLNFSHVRLIEKNGFQIVDAMTVNKQAIIRESPITLANFLEIVKFIKEMTFEYHPDPYLWMVIKKIMDIKMEKKEIYRFLLMALGFDPRCAHCSLCHKKEVSSFFVSDHLFLCKICSFKIHNDKLILI